MVLDYRTNLQGNIGYGEKIMAANLRLDQTWISVLSGTTSINLDKLMKFFESQFSYM